ncbi:MAG: hypothetical protein SVY15_02045 [Halobacteriota archaeon]|nr:hypothetical protein [Halobacteriota archaeon]
MVRTSILNDERAQIISLDFATAAVIFMLAVTVVYHELPDIVGSYTGESTKVYPLADRLGETLVKSPGYWEDGGSSGTDWEANWSTNRAIVKALGFSSSPQEHNRLNQSKVDMLMVGFNQNSSWWEFGSDVTNGSKTIDVDTYNDAAELLGLKGKNEGGSIVGYNFYMQIRPISFDTTDEATADANAEANLPPYTSSGVVLIERMVVMGSSGTGTHHKVMVWVW